VRCSMIRRQHPQSPPAPLARDTSARERAPSRIRTSISRSVTEWQTQRIKAARGVKLRMHLNFINDCSAGFFRAQGRRLHAVQSFVLAGRPLPGVVAGHRSLLRGAPAGLVAPEHERPVQSFEKTCRTFLLEAESPPLRSLGNAVVEATH